MTAPDSQTSIASQALSQTCSTCQVTKPLDEFYNRSRGAPDRKHKQCKVCIKANVALWSKNNRRRKAAYQAAYFQARSEGPDIRRRSEGSRHEGIREWILALKSQNPCADCNTSYPPECIDFDHVRGTKLFNLAAVRGRAISDDDLLAEIQKCDLVCANCHRVRTHSRRDSHPRRLPNRINLLSRLSQ